VDVPANHDTGPADPDPRQSRLDRLSHQRTWSQQGAVGGFGASSSAGFDPVGQVVGTTVAYLHPLVFDRCYVAGPARAERSSADPHNPLLARLHEARTVALARALAECRALGGDGIVGARMSCTSFFSDTTEVTVEGTAVRARATTRPGRPFSTHVRAQDLARLLRSGWMPTALVFGLAIASKHFDPSMFRQTRRGIAAAANQEVSGYTHLVNDARREARRTLEAAVREQGGQGAVVQEMTLRFAERECPSYQERSDYMVEATILGSAMVPFERSEPTEEGSAPLAIMRLDYRTGATGAAADMPGTGTGAGAGPSPGDRAYAYFATRRAARATEP
jgi:uncharacterized protein YbjQ (UPF0145 family)